MSNLFESLNLGKIKLSNRILMAPMTRGRAEEDGTPTPIMATYYGQRAKAGLIITEATAISVQGVGSYRAACIYTPKHLEGWKRVTQKVHAKSGKIFLQLWHTGRVSHPDFLNGKRPVSPSAIKVKGESHTPSGKKPFVLPRQLESSELEGIVSDYVRAAKLAIDANFDGVEVHAANGYLLDQFIRDGSNKRDDNYGGSIENRWRFPLNVIKEVAREIGADRVGVRLSPLNPYYDMEDSSPIKTFIDGAKMLNALELAYTHLVEPLPKHFLFTEGLKVHPRFRQVYDGNMILNGGYLRESAETALKNNEADAIAFGFPFIANPNLPEMFKKNLHLKDADKAFLYTSGQKGYTDY